MIFQCHLLIEATHYFRLTGDEFRRQSLEGVFGARASEGILITKKGHLKLVKSFTDDLAWRS